MSYNLELKGCIFATKMTRGSPILHSLIAYLVGRYMGVYFENSRLSVSTFTFYPSTGEGTF